MWLGRRCCYTSIGCLEKRGGRVEFTLQAFPRLTKKHLVELNREFVLGLSLVSEVGDKGEEGYGKHIKKYFETIKIIPYVMKKFSRFCEN